MTAEPPVGLEEKGAKDRLLAAALELFTRRGYAATTVRELVEAAGITKPALYYYFGSKEGIYRSLVDGALSEFNGTIDELAAAAGSAQERIVRICRVSFESSLAHLEVVRLFYAIYYGPPQGAPQYDFEQLYSRLLASIAAAVEDGIAAGEFKPLPVHELAWGILSILNTIVEEQLCRKEPRIDGRGMENILAIFLGGISKGDAQ